jgi:hypothetical protein
MHMGIKVTLLMCMGISGMHTGSNLDPCSGSMHDSRKDCSYVRIWTPYAYGDSPYAYGEEGKKKSHMGTPCRHNEIVRIWGSTYRSAQSDAGTLFQRGWAKALGLGFAEIAKKLLINLILWLLVFLMNCSPAVKNGGQNGIRCQRRAPKQYK